MAEKANAPLADLQKQWQLLQKEYEYEKDVFWQNTREATLARKVQQGVCWYPVRLGSDRYNSLNQLTVEVDRLGDEEIEHAFEYGRPVCFFRLMDDGTMRYLNFSAVISYVQDNRMVVALPGVQALAILHANREDLGVQLYFDDTTYRTMFAALKRVMEAEGTIMLTFGATAKGTPIECPPPSTRVMAQPFSLSATKRRGVVRLKPNRSSMRNVSYHSKGINSRSLTKKMMPKNMSETAISPCTHERTTPSSQPKPPRLYINKVRRKLKELVHMPKRALVRKYSCCRA